jgi:glucose-6-phosphate-specific signal transduction histidine kinase
MQNILPESGDIIKLGHTENMISIEFALLNYSNANENVYSRMLKGWEKDWVTSKSNMATYSNLKPGKYTFLVKAADSEGRWTEKAITLTVIIAYPFYQTWWFILLVVLCLAALVYWFVQQRIGRIKEKYQLRNKIASDLHDEIGSTLTSINILSNVSQQAMELQPQQAKEMLKQISAQSKTIQQNMSDIVWSIRPDNEKVGDLITRMREYAAQTLEQLDIDIVIEADDELAAKTLPMQYRKELLLIFKEGINNIAKHAGATRAVVSLKNGHKHLQLTIADNGKWKGSSTGTGTRSMKERAVSMGGTLEIFPSATGTEVITSIPVT